MATVSTGYTFVNNETVTPAKLNSLAGAASVSGIVNADISLSAAIADTKLATISTAGKVSNSATTATNANTASAIVARDSLGSFSAATITANSLSGPLSGNASSATKLFTARTFSLYGDITSTNVNFDGTGNVSLNSAIGIGVVDDAAIATNASIADTKLATISTTGKVANSATTATNANTASAIVARDSLGSFSAATITAALAGNAATATSATTATHLAGGSVGTLPYQSGVGTTAQLAIGTSGQLLQSNGAAAPSWKTATNANTASAIVARDSLGSFSAATITSALTGNASTATKLATARTFSLYGDVTSTNVTFDGTGNVSLNSALGIGVVDNASIVDAAGIVDSKLSAITSAGKVANSATTATNANTASAIVARDSLGSFSAATITAALTGNASTATKLATARTISLTGNITGSASFDGNANSSIATTIAASTITAAMLDDPVQKQICKAWVNFDGTSTTGSTTTMLSGQTLVASAGGTTLTWTGSGFTAVVGQTYVFTVSGSTTLGGVNIDPTTGVRLAVTSATSTSIVLTLSSGTFASAVNVISTGSNVTYKLLAIRSSYNVSSITRNALGDYNIAFTTAMTDTNYCVSGNIADPVGGGGGTLYTGMPFLTSYVRVLSMKVSSASNQDSTGITVAIFGN